MKAKEMTVKLTAVGIQNRSFNLEKLVWPKGWPIPREGDSIEIPGLDEVSVVRTVVWYPLGSNEDEYGKTDPEPFVYIVVGPARR